MAVIGLDIGTTGCKAIVFDEDWRIAGRASREYSILAPQPTVAEQDAELVWNRAIESLREAVAQSQLLPGALALSVQGEAIIPVGADGVPIRNAILGMDTRTVEEVRELGRKFDPETLFAQTGMPMHTMNTITKLMWLRKHESAVWKSAKQFLLYEDYFLCRLTGKATISHCLASRTQMYDLGRSAWATDILDSVGVDPGRLATIAPVEGGIVGTVAPEIARSIGLDDSVAVVSGGHDQACAALGCAVIEPGLAMVSTGTAEVVEVAMNCPQLDPLLRTGGISVYRHVVPGLYLAMTLNHSGGLSLRWYRDTLCRDRVQEAVAMGVDPYDRILADAPTGPTDLMILPHFCGSGTPQVNPSRKAAILGLSFASTQASIAKAILEGLTFELRLNLDLLRQAKVPIRELHAVGGGARSSIWLGLKADICGIPLRVPKVTEAACLGAAMLASVGIGGDSDLSSATASAVHFDRRIEPDLRRLRAYEPSYALYQRLYSALIEQLPNDSLC